MEEMNQTEALIQLAKQVERLEIKELADKATDLEEFKKLLAERIEANK